ncbi:MAG: DNA polymerase III subunit epsilon [Rhodospirillaceae bacterium]|jgi:DNA polymerase-3 subunit epsilon|nr:DNA polymerase III subunit epsilon [Rhodospirillaceae bacterium]
MREVVLDTETTGLDVETGHRLVEIGCVELVNHLATGKVYHTYINPNRDIPEEAIKIHGLSEEFLREHPTFAELSDDFLGFIEDSPLIIHNADFDLKFINLELKIIGYELLPRERAVDTMIMARCKFPGSPVSLNALCRRFNINSTMRSKHGALLDAELLANVYFELIGGSEPELDLNLAKKKTDFIKQRHIRHPRSYSLSETELLEHEKFCKNKLKNSLWLVK